MARKSIDDGLPEDPETEVNHPPDPWAVMNRLTAALERLSEQRAHPGSEAASEDRIEALISTLTPALARLAEAQVESGKLIASETRRAHRPSNEVVPGISVFNRRGVNLSDDADGPRKPPLKCPMMIPWLVEWESCTREEIELLNLLESGDYMIFRTDKSRVRISVTVDYKADMKTASRLVATHDTAFNNDNKNLLPPMADYIRQMLKQHPLEVARLAAAVMTDEEEEALIEAGKLSVAA